MVEIISLQVNDVERTAALQKRKMQDVKIMLDFKKHDIR